MNNKNIYLIKGSVGLIAIIVVAAILVIGGGVYFVTKKSPEQKVAEVETAVGDIGASVPNLDFNISPVPDLNVSSLNIGAAQPKFNNVFSAPSVNSDFSYKPNLEFNLPSVSASDINFQIPTIPTGIPKSKSSDSAPTSAPQSNEIPSSVKTEQPSVDCSVFASVPSCSMTGSGEAMCKQCFPNK